MLIRYITLIILIAVTLLAVDAFAYDVPKDAVIKVFTKDGKQIGEMSRSEYKVVKLGTSNTKTIIRRITKAAKHNIIVHGGVGKDGLDVTNTGGAFNVRQKNAAVGGLSYCQNEGDLGLCASVFTNKTLTLGLKFNF